MPGPFPDTTVEAVGTCLRTLAQQSDADAPLAGATAATLSGLRAFADRLALRRRFHDAHAHSAHRPDDAHAGNLFDLLELGRLDAVGARWLAGIARNLTAHPGLDDDGLRWLAFERLSGHAGAARKSTDGCRRGPEAAAAPRRAAARISPRTATMPPRSPPPRRRGSGTRRSTWRAPPPRATDPARCCCPGATSACASCPSGATPVARRPRCARIGRPGTRRARPAPARRWRRRRTHGDYHAYTTAFDRVVNALTLANRAELVELHSRLETELSAARAVIARLAKRLMRVLMARQTREWAFDLDEGVLDGSRLARLVASGRARPFKQESDSPFPSTVVTLLIDHSGSMRGRPMLIAALTVEIFARVLERCGVRCEVLGFTTREWDGGEPAREWAADGYPENPGRLNALEHIVIKHADVPWRRARAGARPLPARRDPQGEHRRRGRELGTRPAARTHARPGASSWSCPTARRWTRRRWPPTATSTSISTSRPWSRTSSARRRCSSPRSASATTSRRSTPTPPTIARIDHLGPALSDKLIALLGDTAR